MPSDFEIVCEFDPGEAFIDAAGDDVDAADESKHKKPRKFKMNAYNGGRMSLGGFPFPVVVDLSGLKIPAKSRPILRDHDPSRIVGHTEAISVNNGTLRMAGVMSAANDHTREIMESADNGFPWQASIGARSDRMAFIDEGETTKVNGRTFTGPMYVARNSTLRETSFVALGADDNTSAKIAANAVTTLEAMEMKFEQWLQARGFGDAELSEEQTVSLRAMYTAEIAASESGDDNADDTEDINASGGDDSDVTQTTEDHIADMRASAASEVERQASINTICDQYQSPTFQANNEDVDIRAHAIREGWNADRTELEAMRAARPAAPAIHVRSHERDCNLQAMQGAVLLRAGHELNNEAWQGREAHALRLPQWMRAGINDTDKNRIMEASHRFNDMSLVDICGESVRMDGGNPSGMGRTEMIQAAFSGGTLTSIFTTNVNASLLAAYQQSADTTDGWTSSSDVADFKTLERVRMAKGGALDLLPRAGTADHANRSDVSESYKIHRFAKQFVVDEQDIIDDSMNALSDAPAEFGQAAARLRPDLVYSILFANAALADAVALFHAASHGNLATTATLAAATLQAGITAIETQQDNGVNLNLTATHLIVPSDLRFSASQLLNSAELRDTTASTLLATRNPIQDENLTLVSDSRLSNGVTDPVSGTAHAGATGDWFLAGSGHTIEVAYLRGTGRAPTVRSFNLTQGQFGLGWDVKMDIGAKALDYRALYTGQA